MSIYDNIAFLCKKQRCSIAMLEKDLGFSRGSIFKWTKHAPSIERIKKVADYFGVSIEDLIKTK